VYWIQGALDDTKRIEVLYLGHCSWRCDFQVCMPLHLHPMSIRARGPSTCLNAERDGQRKMRGGIA
jgi:hypothetical protein